jgi:hypothetical protein
MRDYQTKANEGGGADTITAEKLGAGEANSYLNELENAVSKTGQALTDQSDSGDDEIFTQLATAQFINAISAQTFQDGGIASAYIATPLTGSGGLVVPTDYAQMNGAIISFIPDNANPAGASTLNFGQTSSSLLGIKNILSLAGAPLASGVLDAVNFHDFMFSVAANSWIFIGKKRPADPSGGLYDAYGKWSDEKTAGVDGGTFTNGAWRDRDLNKQNSNDDNIATLSGGELTILVAGKYGCKASAPARNVNEHAARLWNITTAAVLIKGTAEEATSGNSSRSHMDDQFTATVDNTVIKIQHQGTSTSGTSGFGKASGFQNEVYTTIELWRVA